MKTPQSDIQVTLLLKALEAYDGFDEQALEEIERRSALDLFPRFRMQAYTKRRGTSVSSISSR